MSNFSQGVTNLQNNMHNIFGGLKMRHNNNNNNNNNNKNNDDNDNFSEINDRQDLMEDDDELDINDDDKKTKSKSRRPKETDFTQQRLKAFHPILTAKAIIPMFILLAIIFVPIGGAMLNASNNIQDFTINYAYCSQLANSDTWTDIPLKYYTHHFKTNVDINPKWKLATNNSNVWNNFDEERNICQIQFQIPHEMKGPIFLFYKLIGFHANHRQYVKSFSEDQLNGKDASISLIKDTVGQNCQPLSINEDNKIYYPCGLIANSMFNDTFDETLIAINNTNANDYIMTTNGISWSTNKYRFKKTKYNINDIVPPPNWVKLYPNGYNETNLPDISKWPQFQNWMSPAALSDFSNMVLRNDNDNLPVGLYQVNIGLHFPTTEYNGGKLLYMSTASSIGGKNAFLGVSWIIGGFICLALALLLGFGVLVKGRRAGDTNLLSWNKEQMHQVSDE
ncbi:hypothetical protein C6P40_001184 [Pichia californica]|uniref:Cell division control protein 50 n=1 Tax=Pichia californica TaxID=460514 RepID=A0A9P6WJU1_9ASCO|nr:hypothetical protein C6P40_001184 [[Candida] californica]